MSLKSSTVNLDNNFIKSTLFSDKNLSVKSSTYNFQKINNKDSFTKDINEVNAEYENSKDNKVDHTSMNNSKFDNDFK